VGGQKKKQIRAFVHGLVGQTTLEHTLIIKMKERTSVLGGKRTGRGNGKEVPSYQAPVCEGIKEGRGIDEKKREKGSLFSTDQTLKTTQKEDGFFFP